MTETETKKIIASMIATYPNYKPDDIELATTVWCDVMSEYTYKEVDMALKTYIRTSTSGFAPTPGQLIDKIQFLTQPQELNEQEAWSLVANAIRNSGYNSVEEFAKLPTIVQKAVGQPSQLREWALTENLNMEVAMSSFQRAYKVELSREKELQKIPSRIRQLIENVNQNSYKAQIEQKNADVIKISSEVKQSEIKALETHTEHNGMSKETEDKLNEVMDKLKNG